MPDDDKKLQYLKRGDVRTMEKDVTRLREHEAEITREKITQLRTEEEVKKAADLSAEALARAEEREMAEAGAKEKLVQGEALKQASQNAEILAGKAREEAEELEKEKLRAQFKEAQSKEEEERRRFLESVAEKAGEAPPEPPPIPERPAQPPIPPRPTPPIAPPIPSPAGEARPEGAAEKPPEPIAPPAPSVPTPDVGIPPLPKKPFKFPLPKVQIPKIHLPKIQMPKVQMPNVQIPKVSLPKVPMPKVEGYFPKKSSIFEKIWIRIVISLFVLSILATLITFWYWYLAVRPAVPAPTTIIQKIETTPVEPKITQGFLGAGYYFPTAPRVIDTIIIHSGFNTSNGDSYDIDGIIRSYKKAGVSTHYLISREGDIFQLAPDYAIAYHAGAGKMPDGRIGVNNFSIGISLVYQETEEPNDIQYQSLSWLVKELQGKYNIPSENILGYKDVAPEKTTPWNFDKEKLKLLFSSFLSPSPSTSFGAEFILKNLTLEEKIGQLFVVGFDGLELTPQLENFLKTVHPGGIILFRKNIESASQVKKLIQDLQKISLAETGLPLLAAVDQEGGVVSRISFIKEKTGQSEIENADQAYEIGLERGLELKEMGINLNLAPVLDLTQAGDFLHGRSFQKNLEETGNLAKALISGQKAAGILTSIKHFPGYGGITFNPEEKLTAIDGIPQTLHFQEAMEAKPEFAMLASVIYPNLDTALPIAFSKEGVSFLKRDLGETVLVITDDLSQYVFLDNFSLKEMVSLPLEAGADVLLFSGWEEKIKGATEGLSEELINRAVLRIIRLKQTIR